MSIRVGAVQAEPVWLDLEGSIEETIKIIQQAGSEGVQVLGFPEVFIPGCPVFMWAKGLPSNFPFLTQYIANSMARESPEMDRIRNAVEEAGIFMVLGYIEKEGGSLYIAQSFISPEGVIVNHRRKIKPTHMERTIWGEGGADSLKTVVDTPFGKVGGLNFWENLQPLLRFYEYSQGVQIHVASWPPMFDNLDPENVPWSFHQTKVANRLVSQFFAIESQAFVIAASQVLTEEKLGKLNLIGSVLHKDGGGGFSVIFGPDGTQLTEPFDSKEEGIVKADINLGDIDGAKIMTDTTGHNSRPDLLSL